jgi:hypothetical protein
MNIYLLIKFEIIGVQIPRQSGKKTDFEKEILKKHIRKYFLKSGEIARLSGKTEHH